MMFYIVIFLVETEYMYFPFQNGGRKETRKDTEEKKAKEQEKNKWDLNYVLIISIISHFQV